MDAEQGSAVHFATGDFNLEAGNLMDAEQGSAVHFGTHLKNVQ